jgi:hypothetical protein
MRAVADYSPHRACASGDEGLSLGFHGALRQRQKILFFLLFTQKKKAIMIVELLGMPDVDRRSARLGSFR